MYCILLWQALGFGAQNCSCRSVPRTPAEPSEGSGAERDRIYATAAAQNGCGGF